MTGVGVSALQILSAVVSATGFGISELFDHNSASASRTFDSSRNERFWSSLALLVGIVFSCGLVILVAILDPSGLTDEKMWLWPGLLYLLIRRWKLNRRIDRICEKFTKFAVRLPKCYHFGFPQPFEKDYLKKHVSFRKYQLLPPDTNEASRKVVYTLNYREERHEGSRARPIYVREKESQWFSKFFNIERVTIMREPGGHPRNLGRYVMFSVTRTSEQMKGNSIFFPDGAKVRDQYLLSFETRIEQNRKLGQEHVAVAAAWAFVSLVFNPFFYSTDIYVMRTLQTYNSSSSVFRRHFPPGWERLSQIARGYIATMLGGELRPNKGLANLVAALAHTMIRDKYEPMETILPVVKEFWRNHVKRVIEAAWGVEDPIEYVVRPSMTQWERTKQSGYGGRLQRELMREIECVLGHAGHERRCIDEEVREILKHLARCTVNDSGAPNHVLKN